MKLNIKVYTLTGAGTEIDNFNVTDTFDEYLIKGSSTAIGNYSISVTGTPQAGEYFRVKYKGTLDITTNGTTFTILGQALTQLQLNSDLDIECFYDGSAWEVLVKPSFTSAVVSAANLASNAVTASAIANGSIDLGVKGIAGSLITNRIVDLAVTTQKLADLSVTDAKINDVSGSKITDSTITTAKLQDNSVTNDKLNTMTASSIKIGDASGNPTDLALGNNEIPIGNGSTVTKVNALVLGNSMYRMATIPINFNSATSRYRVYFPIVPLKTIHIHTISLLVSETIAGTDNGDLDVVTSTGAISNFTNIVVAANATPATEISPGTPADNYDLPASFGAYIDFVTIKTTAGGQIVANIYYEIQ